MPLSVRHNVVCAEEGCAYGSEAVFMLVTHALFLGCVCDKAYRATRARSDMTAERSGIAAQQAVENVRSCR